MSRQPDPYYPRQEYPSDTNYNYDSTQPRGGGGGGRGYGRGGYGRGGYGRGGGYEGRGEYGGDSYDSRRDAGPGAAWDGARADNHQGGGREWEDQSRSYRDTVPAPRRDDYYAPPGRPSPAPQQQQYYSEPAPYVPYADHTSYPPVQPNQYDYGSYGQTHSHTPPVPPPQHQHGDTRPPRASERPVEVPSASVVLLGLPMHVTDVLLRNFLEDMGASIDSTTVIIDRATGLSKRYGFAKFSSVEHARAFVEPNWPAVAWRDREGMGSGMDDGLKVKINYSQKTGGWRDDQGAGARLTEDQRKASEATKAPEKFYINDGTRDIGTAPTQILLLRGLDPLTSEEEIVKSLSSIPSRVADLIRAGGIKKILITKDRASRSSWGYAFVQFADVQLATEVLACAFNPHLFPTGYRIRSSIIAFSYSHENSFIPIYARSEWSFKGEGGQQLAYWDDKAFVNPWSPPSDKPIQSLPTVAAPTKVPVEAVDADMEAFLSSIEAEMPTEAFVSNTGAAASAPPTTGISIQIKPIAATTLEAGVNEAEARLRAAMTKSKKDAPVVAGPQGAATPSGEKKKGELIQSKKAAVNINKWNSKQAELASTPDLTSTTESADPTLPISTNLATESTVEAATVRKTKSLLANSTKAKDPSIETLDQQPPPQTPQYVDRAAARREAFNQPEVPVSKKRKAAHPPSSASTSTATAAPIEQPNKNGIEESNVGSKMLEKMGWAKGAGLGSTGSGIVAPIEASQFQLGAGLGSVKGVVVGKYDSTPKGYAEKLRDKARNRLLEEQ